MTTSTIIWHKPGNTPCAGANVLLGMRSADGVQTTCEGFLSDDMHGNPCWYDVTAQPIEHSRVIGWADLPECPL
jgi:hypothetical protein